MKLLLDTQLLLWAAQGSEYLPPRALELMEDAENELFFSVASIWEIVIKCRQRREDFKVDPILLRRGLLGNGYTELPIHGWHVLAVDSLPQIHKDPFDRLLVAQSIAEGFILLTADILLAEYPGSIQHV